MNRATQHNCNTRRVLSAAAALAIAVAVAAPSFGQPAKGGKAGARSAAPARSAPSSGEGAGLAALSDDALLNELAGRQMQGLLDHAFRANNVPQAQRAAMLAIPAIERLGDKDNPPAPHERAQLIQRIAAGQDKVVAGIDDPARLMELSTTLLEAGVNPEVNLIEYWGESPKVRKRLEPVISTVMKMLDKAVETGTAERSKLEEQLNEGRNKRVEELWTKLDGLVTTAEYTRAMVTYNEALAIPPDAKGLEKRKVEATAAIEFLQAYDNADSGVQAAVRNRIAKLNMAMREFGPANDYFESVVGGKVDDKTKIDPPPGSFEQYEARYFSVVCELMQGDIPRAKKGVEDVVAWQKENVKDPEVLKQLDAAADLLRYRIATRERDRAKDPAAKKAAEGRAFAVLLELNEKQPALRPIIAEQLIEAMGDNVDVAKADLLILHALLSRGVQAREAIDDPNNPDPELTEQVEQAVAAARELMKRKDPKIVAATVNNAAIQIPLLLQQIGRKAEAAEAFMDFIEKKQGNERNIKAAFDRAGFLLFNLLQNGDQRNDPAVAKAWERFLPIAVDRFGRKEFAFDHANRLRAKNPPQYADAVKYFRMVPANDKRLRDARFREMVTLTDWIYAVDPATKKPLLNPQERAAKVQEALKVGEEVLRLETAAMAAVKDEARKAAHRRNVAVVILTQAELAASGDKPDWQRVLAALGGFEQRVAGMENEAALTKKVMELRVASLMQLKQFNKAADVLIALLQKEPGGRAQGMVLGILQRLNEDFDRARAAGDDQAVREILSQRSNLSGFLVKWASESKDANVRKNLYVYKLYDADTQRLYGSALEGEAKQAQLQKAMGAFQALWQPAEVAAFKAMVEERKKENPKDKTDPEAPDPGVTLGMALTSFDLRDWKTASTELKRLRFAGKLGARSRTETDAKTGETQVVPNDQYWEAMYKYYEATRQWALAEPQNEDAQKELEAVKILLRRDYVAGADEVGGTKWREAFEALRKELIPDLNVEELRQSAPPDGAAPAETQPAPVADTGSN